MQPFYVIPVAEPPAVANPSIRRWQSMGYKVMIQIDHDSPHAGKYEANEVHRAPYRGYPHAVNTLCDFALNEGAEIVVTGGVDIWPDGFHKAETIAAMFIKSFPDTFGVMQPIGDDWMKDKNGIPASARICGSPWMGREFIRRINQGRGPFWPEYYHFYCDEEMQCVTQKLGILWNPPNISQYHDHWTRRGVQRPSHLLKARADWNTAKALFNSRKEAGFPGHEPLPCKNFATQRAP